MSKIVILFLAFLFGLNCYSNEQLLSKSMKKAFNEKELEGISLVLDFMDSLTLAKTSTKNLEKAYHIFFDSIARNIIDPGIGREALDEEHKFNFFNKLDSSVFKELWEDKALKWIKTKDTTIYNPKGFHSIDANTRGSLMNYFKLLKNDDKDFKKIYDEIELSGSVTGLNIFNIMFYQQEQLDFSNLDLRFWAAIFYLSLEESVEQKIERYYK